MWRCFALALIAIFSADAGQPVSIQMREGVFAVVGWSAPASPPQAGWASLFRVYAGDGDVPPLIGAYAVEDGTLLFRPRYSLSPGVRARAVFATGSEMAVESTFDIPRVKAEPTTRVAQVYPTSETIPENQLKFYIEFSAPMSQGDAWRHLALLDDSGTPVELPFLEIDQEMWDPERRRLTVLFDPGRIKRGVLPLEDIGPALEKGRTYTLVVDAAWRDAKDVALSEGFQKRFRVVEADRAPIDPSAWKVGTIRPGTKAPLLVDFSETLDSALAQRLIWIENGRGRVQGRVALEGQERQWLFIPLEPWSTGPFTLRIDTALEDLAGNRVGRPFDVDTFERVSRRVTREVLSIPLRIGE